METNPNKKKNQHKDDDKQSYAKYAGIVFQMGLVIGIGVWAGVKLDEYFKNEVPLYTVILSLVSVFASMYLVLKDFIKKD